MFKPNHRVETILRIGLMLILCLNACGPSRPTDHSAATKTAEAAGNKPNTLPVVTPVYYNPPTITTSPRTSAEADKPASSLPVAPAKAPVELDIASSPAMIPLNGQVTLNVRVRNNSSRDYANLVYSDSLEKGIEFVPGRTDQVIYDANKREISFTISFLPKGQEKSFSYLLRVTDYNPNDPKGELWLHSGHLTGPGGLDVASRAAFVVTGGKQAVNASVAAVQPQGGWVTAGAVSVYFPENTVKKDSILVAARKTDDGKGPDVQYDLSVNNT
ncbi:MAG TPA: hypothetical protein VMW38_26935, partial [Terriglobia bacterium]|nr:hypothetical protein [Terriglobia bacterium]